MARRLVTWRMAFRSLFAPLALLLAVVIGLGPTLQVLACHALTFSGGKYEDKDGDGVKETGDVGLSGWTITVQGYTNSALTTQKTDCDTDNDTVYDDWCTAATTTGTAGTYTVTLKVNSSAGYWKITETAPSGQTGWYYSNPANGQIVVNVTDSGATSVYDKNFLNVKPGQLMVDKDWKLNNESVTPAGVTATICVSRDGGMPTQAPAPTDGSGNVITPDGSGRYCQTFSDTATWKNLFPGTYQVAETVTPAGWTKPASIADISVASGSTASLANARVVTNVSYSLRAFKFYDTGTHDGVYTAGADYPIAGWQLCASGPGITGTSCKSTDANGYAEWTGLPGGTYTVTESLPTGWHVSTSGGTSQTAVLSCSTIGAPKFGNYFVGQIDGYKFSDIDGDGTWDKGAGETGITGWTIVLIGTTSGGAPVSLSTTTDAAGAYSFTNLEAGTYQVCEAAGPAGFGAYRQTAPAAGCYTVVITASGADVVTTSATSYDFGNQQLGSLTVNKIIDWNGAEPLAGEQSFLICIQGSSFPADPSNPANRAVGQCQTVTVAAGSLTGSVSWTGLIPGSYAVTENPGMTGSPWQVSITSANVSVPAGGSASDDVTNTYARGPLTVTKSVDWGTLTPDTAATFEICIKGPSFPNGNEAGACQTFAYNGGSYTWTDLIPGSYTVTEKDPGSVWAVGGSGVTVTVTSNGTPASATITNSRGQLGGLDVTKTVAWFGKTPVDRTFQVCITGPSFPNGSETGACQIISYVAATDTATKASWDNLIAGDYTVVETNPNTFGNAAGYGWAVPEVTYKNGLSVAVVTGTARGVAYVYNETGTATAVQVKDWKVVGGGDSVAVNWTSVWESNLAEYRLYRSAGGDLAGAGLVARISGQGGSVETKYSYTDSGLAAGGYNYWLVEVDGSGAETTVAGPTAATVGVGEEATRAKVFVPLLICR